jgi:hypothetical protein
LNAGSRLSGLRSLFASLGLKGLSKVKDPPDQAPERIAAPIVEAPAEPPARARIYTPFPDASAQGDAASPPPEMATRDFPPLGVLAETVQVEFPQPDPATARRDPRDEVKILPSRRGQYKKK